jgi:hypothetical protein
MQKIMFNGFLIINIRICERKFHNKLSMIKKQTHEYKGKIAAKNQ